LFGSAVAEARPVVTDHYYPLYIIVIVISYVVTFEKQIIYITILTLQMQRG